MTDVKIQAVSWADKGEIISLWRVESGFEVRCKFWTSPIPVPATDSSMEAMTTASNKAHGLYYENLGNMYTDRAKARK